LTNISNRAGAITNRPQRGGALQKLDESLSKPEAESTLVDRISMMPVKWTAQATGISRKTLPSLEERCRYIALTAKAMPDDQHACNRSGRQLTYNGKR